MRILIVAVLALGAVSTVMAQSASQSYSVGGVTKYSTKGHPKAKGVNLQFSYPTNWNRAEGERPNIVQKFTKRSGKWVATVMIITKDIGDENFSDADLAQLYTGAELSQMLPDGAKFVSSQATRIETLRAGLFEYRLRAERAGLTMDTQVQNFVFISGRTMTIFQCSIGAIAPIAPAEMTRQMEAMKPVFHRMANSIILPDLWR